MRIPLSAIVVSAFLALAVPANADRVERGKEAYRYAEQVIETYGGTSDPAALARGDGNIERAWRELTFYYGMDNALAANLALIRARAATSRRDKRRVAKAWQTALELQPRDLPRTRRLALTIQAANATGAIGDVEASSRHFAAARSYAFDPNKRDKLLELQLRMRELRLLGGEMEWRRLRDNLLDLRKFSEGFNMWSMARLDALLGEAEIRLMYEPEIEEKRTDLADLKAKIELAMKGLEGTVPSTYVDRVRTFYYTVEDNYDLASR